MSAREDLRRRWIRLKGGAAQICRTGLSAGAVTLGMEAGIHALLAAVLAGGVILGAGAPFGVAMVAASGTGVCGGAALVGAGFGYLTQLPFSDGLRYFSAAILTFAVAFAFYDVPLMRRGWVMAVGAGVMNFCTGLIYYGEKGWLTRDVICFLTEVLLTVGSTYCFRQVLLRHRPGRETAEVTGRTKVSMLVFLCCILVSLSPVYLWRDISLGRGAGVVCALAAGWRGGCGPGAVLGLSVGLALDLASGHPPLYAMALGVSALAGGSFRGRGRQWSAVAFVLTNAAATLWTWEEGMRISLLYEVMLGSLIFVVLPDSLFRPLLPLLRTGEGGRSIQVGQEYVRRRLYATAGAFRGIYESLRGAFRAPANENDVAAVFDRAAGRVCRSCALRSSCWERDYVTTYNALNDATAAMLERGRGESGDFPRHFTARCLHFPAFLEAINQELTALLYRRQYNSRLRESRMAVCRQYGQLAALLDRAAAELEQTLLPDLPGKRKVEGFLASLGLEGECEMFRDEYGRLRGYIRGEDRREAARYPRELERTLGIPLRITEGEDGLELVQLEPLMAVAGIAARKKDGETVCGDAGTYFKREDGTLYVLLCDGMGSGPLANRESTLAIRLLEQFLSAGVDTSHALLTLNSALALRGEEEGGFTTVDLLQVDLFTGEGSIYKLGAAPTYIRRGDSVRRITGASLPAGVNGDESVRPDCTRVHLEPGDCVLMVSDGVSGTGEDDWVRRRLAGFRGDSPKELARSLITDSPEGATDDRTALVIRLARRGLSE